MQRFLIPFLLLILAAGAVLFYLCKTHSPFTNGSEISLKILLFFFLAFWTELWCVVALLLYLLRLAFGKIDSPRLIFRQSLRHGAWVAFFVVFLLIFQLLKVLQPLNILLLAAFLFFLELYFNRKKTPPVQKIAQSPKR